MQVSKSLKVMLVIGWFVLISILFCLPGSAFPETNWLDKIAFDKWVHVGIFSVLLFLCSWTWKPNTSFSYIIYLLLAAAYGLLVEVVQDKLIPYRGFDWGDLAADVIGSVAGLFFWRRYIKK